MIEQMLAHNKEFVKNGEHRKFQTSKYPDKKIAILTCMDTRLVELLPAALGIKNGDGKMIKNAGGMIRGPFDSAVRSLLSGRTRLPALPHDPSIRRRKSQEGDRLPE